LPFKLITPLDIIVYSFILVAFVAGSILFPFLDIPVFFFIGFFSNILKFRKTLMVFDIFMGVYIYQSLQLTSLIESTQNGISGFFDLSTAFTKITFQKEMLSFMSVPSLISVFFFTSVCVYGGGWRLGRKVFKKIGFLAKQDAEVGEFTLDEVAKDLL
jgi:hypothetical protein